MTVRNGRDCSKPSRQFFLSCSLFNALSTCIIDIVSCDHSFSSFNFGSSLFFPSFLSLSFFSFSLLLFFLSPSFLLSPLLHPNFPSHSSILEMTAIFPSHSLPLFYSLHGMMDQAMTVEVIGHQWNWRHEYYPDRLLTPFPFHPVLSIPPAPLRTTTAGASYLLTDFLSAH